MWVRDVAALSAAVDEAAASWDVAYPIAPASASQLSFEVRRFVALFRMDVKLLAAARTPGTANTRLAHVRARALEILKLCEQMVLETQSIEAP